VDTPIRLCAIRVDFVPDNLTGTTGDGSFNSGFPDSLLIDPLPHDREYFEDHLSFLSHYFETASKGRITFDQLDVYPQEANGAYRLPYPMWHYNFNTDTALLNRRLVELFAESVTLAVSDVDFAQYDAILIFHAGVGKDFNVGFDDTPFDIPSAYISETDLHRYGVSIPAGVTRGLLLPEGQNQTETLNLGVELSLNGVMIKLFGNWLGMPDLFNTETGASGIGRWGMMDQGSGNVNALVPALPDAWSRLFMGWSEAEVVIPSGQSDTVQVSRFNGLGAPEILRIPMSGEEYYLLENRDSDSDSIGYVSVFDRDDREMRLDRFGNVSVETGFKIAIRASHYDYGIPGSGILLWRVNESVIAEKYPSNHVNSDRQNRGVELVEADGAQDIGREYGFATAGSGTELGIQEDCWYRDNRAFRAANGGTAFVRFNDYTRPSARLHDNSYTFLEISDFSDVDSIMSCRIRNTLTSNGFPVTVSDTAARWAVADLNGDGIREFYVQSYDSLFTVSDSLGLELALIVPTGATLDTAFGIGSESKEKLLFTGNPIGFVGWQDGAIDSSFVVPPLSGARVDRVFNCLSDQNIRIVFTAPQAYAIYNQNFELVSARINLSPEVNDFTNAELYPAKALIGWTANHSVAYFDVNDTLSVRWETVGAGSEPPVVIIDPERTLVFLEDIGYLDATNGEIICDINDCLPPQVDWDGDGLVDGGGANGVDYTPRENYTTPKEGEVSVHDLNFDGEPDILQVTVSKDTAGNVLSWHLVALDHDTRRYPNFPLALDGAPELLRMNDSEFRFHMLTTHRASEHVRFSLMRLPVTPDAQIQEIYQAPDNLIIIGTLRPQVHARDSFVYVWPNPATETVHIRVTLPYAATADVLIFDLAGRRVAKVKGSSTVAGPFEIDWQTSGVQSGVYIGRVEATGGGQTQSAELKIAVVR